MSLIIKIADTPEEKEQILQLNYSTFVEEIPQHSGNSDRMLEDRFDQDNTYIIALLDNKLAGMISVNGKRPFSLDHKLSELDRYLPDHILPCEIRLLAVKREHRGGRIFFRLMNFMAAYSMRAGYDLAVISGTTRQLKLYSSIGFKAFGPLVGKEEALYQPMYLTKEVMNKFLTNLSDD